MNKKITVNREDRARNRLKMKRVPGKPVQIFLAVLAALIIPLLVPVKAYAGDINSAEEGVLAAISEKQEYQGAYYKVTDGYIAKVTEYLSRDGIDMSQREADDYVSQFHSNIAAGIASGYMEKVGDVEDTGTDGGTGTGGEAGGNAGAGNGSGAGGDTGTGTAGGNTGTAAGTGTDVPIVDNTTGSTAEGAVEYTVYPADEQTMYVQGIEKLDVHEEAYKDSPVIGSILEGEPVRVTGAASTGWAQIAFGEKTGYVSAVYLRTDGYMEAKEAEKKAEEEAMKAEEAKKAEEEAKKAEEEAEKAAAEAKKAEEEAAAAAEPVKDYSNAAPVEKHIDLGRIAILIVVIAVLAAGGILIYHRTRGTRRI